MQKFVILKTKWAPISAIISINAVLLDLEGLVEVVNNGYLSSCGLTFPYRAFQVVLK